MEINREVLRNLRFEINDAIKEIGDRHGVDLKLGNAKFTEIDCTFQLKGNVQDAGDGRPAAAVEWDRYRNRYGLHDVEFGDAFHFRGVQYNVCGIKPRSPKYPILAKDLSGEVFKFKVDAVKGVTA